MLLTSSLPNLLAVALILPLLSVLRVTDHKNRLAEQLPGMVELGLIAALWLVSFTLPLDTPWLRLQPFNLTLLLLISFIALVVTHYSATSLNGEPDKARFLRSLALTRFAVMLVVASNNLLLMWIAWVGISLSLHHLLLFYPERPRANLAAHKKFIIARIAELMLGAACYLLYDVFGTLQISTIVAHAGGVTGDTRLELIAILLALVAIIKCAQMPIHGWLIQVVEAPTPVSALLHAGIVNLGGFLLIQFAPVMNDAVIARWLVLLVAGPSTVIAALVMSTRISIKVRLAWSTVAQMGLMLIECALGFYELALLHLLAHACYKAHAFLSSGNAVNDYLAEAIRPAKPALHAGWVWAGIGVALLLLGLIATSSTLKLAPWILLLFTALALLSARAGKSWWSLAYGLLPVSFLLTAYGAAKWATAALLSKDSLAHGPHVLAQDLFISLLFIGLFVAWSGLQLFPHHPVMKRLFIMLNAGFYLDEWTTRLTLFLWPVHLPRNNQKPSSLTKELVS